MEPRDGLSGVLYGHPPVGLAVDHIQRQVPQGAERDVPGPARNGNRRHKVLTERGSHMPGPPATHAVAHHHAPPGIDPEALLHRSEGRKGRGFPGGRGPAALRGRGGHEQSGETAQAGEGNQVQKAATIPLGRLPPEVQTEDHRERRVPIVACRNVERVIDGIPIRLGRQMREPAVEGYPWGAPDAVSMLLSPCAPT